MKKITLLLLACSAMGYSQCITNIQASEHQSVIMKDDGTIYSWGWGLVDLGNMGLGPTGDVNTPTQIGTGNDYSKIFAGATTTFAIKNNGSLWGTGLGDQGQLGNGIAQTFYKVYNFVQIGTATDWKQVSSNREHTLSVKNNGTLWAWGSNYSGKLGNSSTLPSSVPIQIGTGTDWTWVTTGVLSSFGLKTDGTLWSWGGNGSGALAQDLSNTTVPYPMQVGTDTDWAAVKGAHAGIHCLALKTDGSLYVFGGIWSSGTGALGLGPEFEQGLISFPMQIGTDTDWVFIESGFNDSFAIKSDGTLWGWGQNDYGQVGDGTTIDKNVPVQIGTDTDWAMVSAGREHTLGLKTNGDLYAWGNNTNSQLGTGDNVSHLEPFLVYTCVATSAVDAFAQNAVRMAPNPAHDMVTVSFEGKAEYDAVEVYDISGRNVFKTNIAPVNNSISFDVKSLANGVYTVMFKARNGTVASKKLVKN